MLYLVYLVTESESFQRQLRAPPMLSRETWMLLIHNLLNVVVVLSFCGVLGTNVSSPQIDHQGKTEDSTKAQPGEPMSLCLLSDHR